MNMRTHILVVWLGALMISDTANSAEVSYYHGWMFNDYYVDNTKVDLMNPNGLDPLENVLSTNREALAQFKSSERTRVVSGIFIGVGIAAVLFDLTWTLVQGENMQQLVGHGKLPVDQFHYGAMLGGAAAISIGIPIRVWSHHQIARAIDIKNSADQSSSLNVYLASNRVGFSYQF